MPAYDSRSVKRNDMKKNVPLWLILLITCAVYSCEDKLNFIKIPETPPQLSGISPTNGTGGTEVVITGNAFSITPAQNIVTFNGDTATVINASTTALTVLAPEEGSTGPVIVRVNGKKASQTFIFTYD